MDAAAAAPLLGPSIDDYLTADVPTCPPEATAGAIRTLLASRPWASANDVAVCQPDGPAGRRLVGLVPIERVLAAPEDARADALMDPDPPVVAPGVDQERAAWKAVRHGESSLAVVGADGRFHGLVPPSRFLAVLLHEHDEDLARLGGYLHSSEQARHASEEPIPRRLWHRLPWLILGLVGSAVAAWLVGGFEEELAGDVRLAFFVPGVVYMADAVGTQTEALVIRGLSVGVPIRRILRAEALTGLAVGMLLGSLTYVAVLAALGSADLALAVALALLAACSIASVVAMALPWAIARTGGDPAFGSGPLATVVQDLLSLVIYFALATALVA